MSRSRRWRWPALAFAVLVAVVAAGALAWPRSAAPVADPDPSPYVVDLGSHPRMAWQHTLQDWAPSCRVVAHETDEPCSADIVAENESRMVLQVGPDSGTTHLVGVDLATGAVSWRQALPARTTVQCRGTPRHLWCIAVSAVPQPKSTDDGVQPAEVAGPAQLISFDLGSGRKKGSASLGASGVHWFVGVDNDFVVIGNEPSATRGADAQQGATTAPTAIQRFDGDAVDSWHGTLPKGVDGAAFGAPMVRSDGIDYLLYATGPDGKGIGFDPGDGSVVSLEEGMAVAEYRGNLVTQSSSGGNLKVAGHQVSGAQVAELIRDNSPDYPLITVASDDGSADSSQVHQSGPPYAITHTVPGLARAFCRGRLITGTAQVMDTSTDPGSVASDQDVPLRAIDPSTGRTEWRISAAPDAFVMCSGDDVVVNSHGRMTGYSIRTGARGWSVTLPREAQISGWTASGLLLAQYNGPSAVLFGYVTR